MTEDSGAAINRGDVFLQLAGRKHRHKMGAQMNESASTGVNAFAKRQLEKLGWKEGEGLGKRRDGMASHIKVKQRADEQGGLGKNTSVEIDNLQIGNEWWKHSVGNTLAKLGGGSEKKSKKSKKTESKKRKRHFTDQELFEATGGMRFGTKGKGKQQTGKWKRAEGDISEKEEQDAKSKVEWDGLAAPKVVLQQEDEQAKKKKKRRKLEQGEEAKEEAHVVSSEDDVTEKEDKKKAKEVKKKLRKEEKKKLKKALKKEKKTQN